VKQLSGLREVESTRYLDSFIPDDQRGKRPLITDAAPALRTIGSTNVSDRENVGSREIASECRAPFQPALTGPPREIKRSADSNSESS